MYFEKLIKIVLFHPPEQSGKGIPTTNTVTQAGYGDPYEGSRVMDEEATKIKEMEKIYADKKEQFDYLPNVAKDIRKYMKTLYRLVKFPSETEGMFEQPNFVRPELKDADGNFIYNSQAVKICDFLLGKLCK